MVNKSNNEKENAEELEKKSMSTTQILKEIRHTVNNEKIRRDKVKKETKVEVFTLSKDMLVKNGSANFQTPMPTDLATLKSLIQTIVRDEINKNHNK